MHRSHRVTRGDHSGRRESLEERCDAEPVIAVAVRDVDGGEQLLVSGNPIRQAIHLRLRQECIHEHGVPLAVNERRCNGLKVGVAHPGRLVLRHDGDARRDEYFPVQASRLGVSGRHLIAPCSNRWPRDQADPAITPLAAFAMSSATNSGRDT